MKHLILTMVLILSLVLLIPNESYADLVFNAQEVGSDVVITGSGTILTDVLHYDIISSIGVISPTEYFCIGPSQLTEVDFWTGGTLSGPSNFGSGPESFASSGTGDMMGLDFSWTGGGLALPRGYTSGYPLESTSTYLSHTFETLGMTEGTYVWTYGYNVITLNVGGSEEVPTLSEWGMILLALLLLALGTMAIRSRRRVKAIES